MSDPHSDVASPTDLERLFAYMRDFELAWMSGDWSLIAAHFHEDAVHEIEGGGGRLGRGGSGRRDVVDGLRRGVEAVDRRFDVRIPEIVEGPKTRDDGVWMRFALTLRRAGLPDLRVEGEHLARYRDGRIEALREKVASGESGRVDGYLDEHAAQLRPEGAPFLPPSAKDLEVLEAAIGRSLVRCYGAAKSEQDAGAALAVCDDGFSIETVAFALASRDRDDTKVQLAAFFAAFPDYGVTLEGFANAPGVVACWGRARLTLRGDFLGIAATGRTAELPVFCVFRLGAAALLSERFFFDLAALCEQVGVPVAELSTALAPMRTAELAA